MTSPDFLKNLNALAGIRAAWCGPVGGLDVACDREEAMRRLRPLHERSVVAFAPQAEWWRAEQVHGNAVAVVPEQPTILAADGLPIVTGMDGLVTGHSNILLAIYVADCGAIWLADRSTGAIGLLHSGKNGTAQNIFAVALETMRENFGTHPENVVAVLSPCIRPPNYEIDFAAEITRQAEAAGVGSFHDCGENTANDRSRYYSYRMEKGKTGRMMAVIVRD